LRTGNQREINNFSLKIDNELPMFKEQSKELILTSCVYVRGKEGIELLNDQLLVDTKTCEPDSDSTFLK